MPTKLSAQEALTTIMAGNDRWARGQSQYPNHSLEVSRSCLENGQHPFAVVLGCSDSRKPVELIMDVGLGEVFVVRNAGHILCRCALASIEYGVLELGAPLIVVMGHQRCGAVAATINAINREVVHDGHIDHIIEKIAPSVATVMRRREVDDLAETVTQLHIKRTVGQLLFSQPVIGPMARNGDLAIVGAYYSLENRRLSLISNQAQEYCRMAVGL